MKKNHVFVAVLLVAVVAAVGYLFTPHGQALAGKINTGGGGKGTTISYVPNYVALIDGAGLYNGSNTRPASYDASAPAITTRPVKVNVLGASTAQLFYNQLVSDAKDPDVQWGDCAYGYKTAAVWADPKNLAWRSCNSDGFSAPDVLIIKTGTEDGTFDADVTQMNAIIENAYAKWPSLKQVYLIDEGWLGYYNASEPNGFKHGEAIKAAILSQISAGKHFVAWGTYLWANGVGPDLVAGGQPGRNDGLEWVPADYGDGLHQTTQGAQKQVKLFLASLLADPVASQWYDGK